MKQHKDKIVVSIFYIVGLVLIGGFIYGIAFWYPAHERAVHLAQGWIQPTGWNCPPDHPIKANLKSMIFHEPGDPYYARTDAMSGECFDTVAHAEKQGFRPIYTH